MARLISPKYFIILGIALGFVFLTHTSLSAQSKSASSDREIFARDMEYGMRLLGECKESQSRLTASRSDLETFYQKYLENLEAERNADAARGKAQSELEAAESALDVAEKEYESKNKKCERLKRVNPHLNYTNIPECVDAANFLLHVVGGRKETRKKKLKDFAQKGDLHQERILEREGSFSDYIREVYKSLSPGISRLMMGYDKEPGRTPNELKNQLDGHCNKLQSESQQDKERATQITVSLVKDCKFGEADRFVKSLPDYKEKADLAKPISDARKREDDAAKKYEEGRRYYREGQIEERAERISQAGDRYRDAIANFKEARAISKCDIRIQQFDKAIVTLNTALARLATASKPVKPE